MQRRFKRKDDVRHELKSKKRAGAILALGFSIFSTSIVPFGCKAWHGDAPPAVVKHKAEKAGQVYLNAEREVSAEPMKKPEDGKPTKCKTLIHGGRRAKLVALTFDDGPHPKYTPRLMKILRDNHVPATFFLVGRMAEKFPKLVKEQADEGHLLANHTYHHVNTAELTPAKIAAEIKACEDVIYGITRKRTTFFRPPGGNYNTEVEQVLADRKYTLALWTVNPGDYEKPGASYIARRIIREVDRGGIVLIHDGVEQTVNALPEIIAGLKARGYTFVTIDKLVK